MNILQRLFLISLLSLLSFGALGWAEDPLPTNVTVLTREDFGNMNAFSVADVLERVAALDIQRDGYRGTRALAKMRGAAGSTRVLVLLDGRPLTHEFNQEVDLSQIPINIVERIVITKGGSPFSYSAEAIAGTIHIVTSRPSEKGLRTVLGTHVGRFGNRYSDGRFFGRSNFGDMTYLAGRHGTGGFSTNEQGNLTNHFGNFTRSFNGRGFWGTEYAYEKSIIGVSSGTMIPLERWNGLAERRPANRRAHRLHDLQHAKVFLAYPLPIVGGDVSVDLTQSYRHLETRPSRFGAADRDEDSRAFTFDLKWRKNDREAGFQRRNLKREVWPRPSDRAHQTSFYALNKWRTNKWIFLPAFRYDRHSAAGSFLGLRVTTLYQMSDDWLFSSSITRGHRNASFEEFFSVRPATGNPHLSPEKAWSYDLGADWKISDWGRLRATGFLIRIEDVIGVDPSRNRYESRGEEKTSGLEAEGSVELGKDTRFLHLAFHVNGTVQKGRHSTNGGNFVANALTPELFGFVRLDHILPLSMVVSNEIRYQGAQFELENRGGLKIPGYYMWNFRYQLKILAADMYFMIENVNEQRYADSVGAYSPLLTPSSSVLWPQPDRTFWVGATIRFTN